MARKWNLLVLLLSALLMLSGCTSMLERSYTVVTDHPEHPAAAADSDVLKAETYQDLVNDVLYFVEQGIEQGAIRLTNYTGSVENDLKNACLEVAQDTPVGAYAVSSIDYDCTRVVQYYEANIYISYRRSSEQMQSIHHVTGASAIRRALQNQLSHFAPEAVLQISYFTEDESSIASLIGQAYYDSPAAALGMPEYTITIYPDSGWERIVEVAFTYPYEESELRSMSQQLLKQVNALSSPLYGLQAIPAAEQIYALLRSQVSLAPNGTGSTAYAALVENYADSEGLALAFQLLAKSCGLDSELVRGSLNGHPHFWNVLTVSEGEFRHVDVSRPDGLLLTDSDLSQRGYLWGSSEVPACVSSTSKPAALQ